MPRQSLARYNMPDPGTSLVGRSSFIPFIYQKELDSRSYLHWFILQKHLGHVKALTAAEGSYRRGVSAPQHPPGFTTDPVRLRAITERGSIEECWHCVVAYDICTSHHIHVTGHSAPLRLISERTDSDHNDDEFPGSSDAALPTRNVHTRR